MSLHCHRCASADLEPGYLDFGECRGGLIFIPCADPDDCDGSFRCHDCGDLTSLVQQSPQLLDVLSERLDALAEEREVDELAALDESEPDDQR